MMIAETGLIVKVAGMRIATAPDVPIPGRTPISVPIRTPIKQYSRFMGWKAVTTPICSPAKKSMSVSPRRVSASLLHSPASRAADGRDVHFHKQAAGRHSQVRMKLRTPGGNWSSRKTPKTR